MIKSKIVKIKEMATLQRDIQQVFTRELKVKPKYEELRIVLAYTVGELAKVLMPNPQDVLERSHRNIRESEIIAALADVWYCALRLFTHFNEISEIDDLDFTGFDLFKNTLKVTDLFIRLQESKELDIIISALALTEKIKDEYALETMDFDCIHDKYMHRYNKHKKHIVATAELINTSFSLRYTDPLD